jgi:PEP-CTERM motif
MRKLFTILAILGLAVGISALSARADGVTYTVTSTYASDVPISPVSAPDASFTFVFTVPSPCTSSTPACFLTPGAVNFTDNIGVTFSSPTLTGFSSLASLTFNPNPDGFYPGLFDLEAFPNGGDFEWVFVGDQIFNPGGTGACSGQMGMFCTGFFPITGGTDFSASLFFDLNDGTVAGDLTGGSVTGTSAVTPEPSSLLLLGSGFLALGGFARRRLVARFN